VDDPVDERRVGDTSRARRGLTAVDQHPIGKTLAHELAERVCSLDYDSLPKEAIEWSKVAVLDTTGVTLAGYVEEGPRILESVLALAPQSGPSLIFGTDRRASPLDAALINGTSAHVLDFDNATNTMFGHASATMVPPLIAAAEAFGCSGRDLLLGHVAGFEAGARIGRGVNMHHYEKGWHPTSSLGVFCVAAACARMLHLDVKQTATALAMSVSLAAGVKANFGTMTKALHVGQCARGGLMAALLAQKGFTASDDAFEAKQGFLNVFNGAGHYDIAAILRDWADPLDVVSPGACYKQYPCCASTHSAVDAALSIAQQHGPFRPEDIAKVESWTSPKRLLHTNRPSPATSLDAKFSIQYCIARALLDRKVVFEHFEGEAHEDARIRGLLPKIHAATYTDAQFPPQNQVACELRVTAADGRVFTVKLDRPVGRTAHNPVAPEQMRAKFESCARKVIAEPQIDAAMAIIDRFETVSNVGELTNLFIKKS
jgi:2-methylcitrate dehydratase PrpD